MGLVARSESTGLGRACGSMCGREAGSRRPGLFMVQNVVEFELWQLDRIGGNTGRRRL